MIYVNFGSGLSLCQTETAFGQELTAIGAITSSLTLVAIGLHLDSMIEKLMTLKNGNVTASHNALKKLVAEAQELFNLVDIKIVKKIKQI